VAYCLVFYSNYTTMRNNGETWDLKIDYASRKAEDKAYTKTLPRASLITIEEISSMGEGFYPEQANLSWWGIEETE